MRRSSRTCNERGDFGYQNVWGSPTLMFDVRCIKAAGHSGKHMAEHTLRIGPTHEKDGLKIDPKSVEITDSIVLIEWENKAAAGKPPQPENNDLAIIWEAMNPCEGVED